MTHAAKIFPTIPALAATHTKAVLLPCALKTILILTVLNI